MTAQQMNERVRFYLDQQKSPRIDDVFHVNQALNSAQSKFIEDRVDNIKDTLKRGKAYYFEAVERVKSELYTLVVSTAPIAPQPGNLVLLPADFYYELNLSLTINSEQWWSTPKTHNEFQELARNAFSEPSIEYPVHLRAANGLTVYFGGSGTFNNSTLTYLKQAVNIDVVAPYVNCILPNASHEEICEGAAHIIAGTYGDWRKSQVIKQEKDSN